ncbi:MAG: 6-bladed beta-propeller [Atribacterota bacterium]
MSERQRMIRLYAGVFCFFFILLFSFHLPELSWGAEFKVDLSIDEIPDANPYFNYPVGILVDDDGNSVFISDWANNRVVILDLAGKLKKILTGYEGPVGLALDKKNKRLFITEQKANRIKIINSITFSSLGDFKPEGVILKEPRGIWFQPDGKLYVVDTGNSRAFVFDQNGKTLLTFGKEGMGDGEFYYPRGISVDDDGRMWVVDTLHHAIQVFDGSGKFLFRFGKEGNGRGDFNRPRYIFIQDDQVLISDYRNNRVKVYTLKGELAEIIGEGSSTLFANPEGIWIDAQGILWVADAGGNRIQKINMNFLLNRKAYLGSLLSEDKIDEFLKEAGTLSPEKRKEPDISRMFFEVYRKKGEIENMILEAENLWMNDAGKKEDWSQVLGELYYQKAMVSRQGKSGQDVQDILRKAIQYGYKKAYFPLIWTSFLLLGGSNVLILLFTVLLAVLLIIFFRIRSKRFKRW